ncbi:MAG: S-layer homology domain-containing protein [Oscillospiraceae bacterium]|nr:S-layer homology domain-containing protein [Oscillospiraceae bacterium]
MKTAKKLLCLLLVMSLCVGLMSFAAAKDAADYTDIDDVDEAALEALYVMTGLGITQGFPEGNFGPKGQFTRAQAAKIIAWLLLGETADKLPLGSTQFSDVQADHYASGYITYCVANGIIVGYPDGTFGPDNLVTTAQFCVMLLRALGYGLNGEYTGDAWAMNAYIDAYDLGIFTLDVNFTEGATREQVVVYAFNALLSYTKTEIVKTTFYKVTAGPAFSTTNTTVSGQDKYTVEVMNVIAGVIAENTSFTSRQAAVDAVVKAITDAKAGATPAISQPTADAVFMAHYAVDEFTTEKEEAVDSLAKTVFGLELDDDPDDLGRPSIVWLYKGAPIFKGKGSDPVETFEKSFTQSDLYKVINKEGDIDATWNAASGQTPETATLTSLRTGTAPANAAGNIGYGVITEIYKVGLNYKAVVIEPSFAKVADVKATAATATKGAFTKYTVGSQDGDVFTSHVDEAFEPDTAALSGTIAKGDFVLYYKGAKVLYIEAVETIEGAISSVTSGGVITLGGNATRVAKAGSYTATVSKDSKSFYVDSFGYILAEVSPAAPPIPIVLVLKQYNRSELIDGAVVTKYFADVVDLSGTVIQAPLKAALASTGVIGEVLEYDIDGDGFYSFATISTSKAILNTGTITTITRGDTSLLTAGPVQRVGNSTLFVVADYKGSDATGTVTKYNGVNAVPSFGSSTSPLAATKAVSITDPPLTAALVADVVFVYDNVTPAAISRYVFSLGTWNLDEDGYAIDVVIGGEKDTIVAKTTTQRDALIGTTNANKLYASIDTSTSPWTITPASGGITGTGAVVSNSGGILFNGATYVEDIEDDAVVYTFNIPAAGPTTYGTSDAADLEPVTLGAKDAIYYVTAPGGGGIVAIYIVIDNRP